ncbi:MAG TPA: BTAD domain-containing putative transcriptional regulator [Gaiellaceae bacterium]|nr:BTAD domain-containing putative transcriptional regulator [Gaiellaceae bacterium]
MEIRVLGPIEAVGEEGPVQLAAPMQRRLLAALVLGAGETCSRDSLIDALWGESPAASAQKLLQVYVSQLRKALPAPARIRTRGGGYALEIDQQSLDAAHFERLLDEGKEALSEGNPALALSLLTRALALWRGPAYADFAYEGFAQGEVERLEELRLVAHEERIAAQLELGLHAELLGEVLSLAAAHPERERLQGQAMLALYRCERQTEALDLYATAHARLHDELGLEPGTELRELQRRILQQDPGLVPPTHAAELLRPLASSPNALLGRERELEELRTMLTRTDVRLLVLTGAGGSGKTRLALELARETAAVFANGTAFVELAPVRDPELVVAAVCSALDVHDVPNQEPLETLMNVLRPRELLLVVDNAEHLRAAAPIYVELLANAPRLRMLVTSRAVLHLSGEHVYPVEPLEDDVAVALLVERAREADPGFDRGSADENTLRRICARLDCLPLAIELAASRIRTLTLEELLARLEPRLPLLVGGPRDLPARQQTLRSTLEWSFELLEEEERGDLSRLAVFAGGCTLDAAEVVCGTTVERMASLVDHNLLRRRQNPEGSRYSLLETVREFALEQVDPTGPDLGRAHAEYFLGLAERADAAMPGPGDGVELARLELEHDNLRAALAWMLQSGESELALRLASALWRFWFVRGHFAEGRLWLERALAAHGNPPPMLLAKALGAAARLTGQLGDLDDARAYAERSLVLYRRSDDLAGLRSALGTLAYVASNQGELGRAAALQEEAIEVARTIGDAHGEAVNTANLGNVALNRHDYEQAESLFRRSRAMFEALGEREPLWYSLVALAYMALRKRRYDEAANLLAKGLALCREVGAKVGINNCLEALAALAVARHRSDDAARLLGCAQQLRENIGLQLEPFEQGLHDETAVSTLDGLGEEQFAREHERGRRMPTDEAIAWALDLSGALERS